KRIQDHDRHAATRGIAQLGHHPRAVRARILADYEDRVGMRKVIQDDGPFADADTLGQPDACRLVTHIRAIRKIVRSEAADEELVQKGGLIRRASGSIEFGLIWT